MKKYIIAFILLAFNNTSYSQVFNTFYSSDTVMIKGVTEDIGEYDEFYDQSIKVNNYDNDGYWSKMGDFYVNYDKNLNVIDTINSELNFTVKYNNTLYGLYYYIHYVESPDMQDIYPIADSVKFYSYNLTTRALNSVNLDTTDIDYNYTFQFMQERKEFAVVSIPFHERLNIDDFDKFRITIIDTLGNITDSNTIYKPIYSMSVAQQGENIMVGIYALHQTPNMYYINKETLNIVDSIYMPLFKFDCLKAINDSLMVGKFSEYIFMYNTVEKTVDSLYFRIPNRPIGTPGNFYYSNDWAFDCKTPDSIFFCYSIFDCNENNDSIYNTGFQIDNFNFNGTFNYRHSFRGFQPNFMKGINGVTCIDDENVIINNTSSSFYEYYYYNPILLRFSLRGGLMGLSNIEKTDLSITLYPNPTTDKINIVSCENINRIELFNILGQRVYNKETNNKNETVDVSNFAKGNYIAKLFTDKGITTKKFVIN